MRKVSDPRSRPRGLQVCTLLQKRDTDTGCGSGSGPGQAASFGRIRIGIGIQGITIRIGISSKQM
jgi:hypothetical protein